MTNISRPRQLAIAAITDHLAEALLIALEATQSAQTAQSAPEPVPPTQRAPGALLSVEDVADALGVAVQTIYRWRTQRPVYGPEGFKVGKYLRWKPEVVTAWLDAQGRE